MEKKKNFWNVRKQKYFRILWMCLQKYEIALKFRSPVITLLQVYLVISKIIIHPSILFATNSEFL